jgi:glucose/arabinose dehydrogenase
LRRSGIAGVVLIAAAFAWAQPATADPPSGFQETVAFEGLNEPAAISFAPNGRIFVAEKGGVVHAYTGLGDSTPTTVVDLNEDVYNFWDRGLLGMTVDPLFPGRPYLYVLYARDAVLGGSSPRWGTEGVYSDPCPDPPGATTDGCLVSGRLVRLTLSGDVASDQTTLLTDWCQQYPSHSVGDLAFGPDGALYVSGGEGASFDFTDWGQFGFPGINPCGDPPGGTMEPPTAEGGALRAQDARTTSDPTGLGGAILRIDPNTGDGLPGNPFFGSGDANQRRIVALGLRNPFRFTLRPGTDEVWAGDVGWTDWEEINRLVDPSDATADNFGWPCYEGVGRQGSYDATDLNLCESLYSAGPVVAPYYAYNHSDQVVGGEGCPSGSSSISGLDFYQSGPFPNSYDGALFFADYSRSCIWAMLPGGNGLPSPSNIQTFNPGAPGPVDLEISPGGDLFYADLAGGTIRRIHAVGGGNEPPNAVATANPPFGPAPLTTTLGASGSSDPDDPFSSLSFAWDADDDGEFDDGDQANLNWTYAAGTHTATVRVTDPGGLSDTDSVEIQAGNTPPSAAITAPPGSLLWGVGDTVNFAATATDPEQGTLPASAFDWELIINHCPSNCHQHPVQQFPDRTSGSFSAPDHEYPSSLLLRLTVTDSGGLTDIESVTVNPRTVNLTLSSVPAGLQLGLNADVATAPFTRAVIEDSQNTVVAPVSQTLCGTDFEFGSWSDGGAAAHSLTASQSQTLTSTYDGDDSTAPNTILDDRPRARVRSRKPGQGKAKKGSGAKVKFHFSANESCASFECRLDKAPFAPCRSPLRIGRVKVGSHRFRVRSRDVAGNLDVTPAKDKFKVVKTKR